MPKVGSKHYAYTPKGQKAAKAAAQRQIRAVGKKATTTKTSR